MNRAWQRRILVGAIAGALIASASPLISAAPSGLRTSAQARNARIITDEVGRPVKMPAQVKRIVTLAPNLTETVFALGLGDRLAGDTDFCDTPEAAKSKPHVGNPQNPSLEAIIALHPDLVLATTSINRLETAIALEHLGIPVYTSDPHTVRGMLDSISRMAQLMGADEQGTREADRLRQRLDTLHARLADRPLVHVLFVVWERPLITVGQNTFIADALRWAGAESVVLSKRNWPQLSLEEVVRLQPEYLVFADSHGDATHLADLRSRLAWKDLAAVEAGQVVEVSEEAVRPSPGLVDAIEDLARKLHPDLFFSLTPANAITQADLVVHADSIEQAGQECTTCAR